MVGCTSAGCVSAWRRLCVQNRLSAQSWAVFRSRLSFPSLKLLSLPSSLPSIISFETFLSEFHQKTCQKLTNFSNSKAGDFLIFSRSLPSCSVERVSGGLEQGLSSRLKVCVLYDSADVLRVFPLSCVHFEQCALIYLATLLVPAIVLILRCGSSTPKLLLHIFVSYYFFVTNSQEFLGQRFMGFDTSYILVSKRIVSIYKATMSM